MKKTKTYKATIEGLTIHDVIEILTMRGESLAEEIMNLIS